VLHDVAVLSSISLTALLEYFDLHKGGEFVFANSNTLAITTE